MLNALEKSMKSDLMYVLMVLMHLQLDLGYPAISYPDISIIRPWSCSTLSIVYMSIFNYSLAQDKNKVVKYLFYFIV